MVHSADRDSRGEGSPQREPESLPPELALAIAYLRSSLDSVSAYLHGGEPPPSASLETAHEALAMAREAAHRIQRAALHLAVQRSKSTAAPIEPENPRVSVPSAWGK